MRIIGLSGTNGSGKDTVGHMLADRHKWLFISLSDILRSEAKLRGEKPTREVLRGISTEWRRNTGSMSVGVDKAMEIYHQVENKYANGLVLASIRHPGEADRLHELGGLVVWVDADEKIRYERLQANKALRGRLEEDEKTFEEFISEEQAEMTPNGDKTQLNMASVKEKADIEIRNDGDDIADFQDVAERALLKFISS